MADSPVSLPGKERSLQDTLREQNARDKERWSIIKGVSNIWMPVQDTDRAVDFYENILGFPVVKRDGAWAEVDASGLIVGLRIRVRLTTYGYRCSFLADWKRKAR